MDPKQALIDCLKAIRDGDKDEAYQSLISYYQWRIKGGFEPTGIPGGHGWEGDVCAENLAVVLADLDLPVTNTTTRVSYKPACDNCGKPVSDADNMLCATCKPPMQHGTDNGPPCDMCRDGTIWVYSYWPGFPEIDDGPECVAKCLGCHSTVTFYPERKPTTAVEFRQAHELAVTQGRLRWRSSPK